MFDSKKNSKQFCANTELDCTDTALVGDVTALFDFFKDKQTSWYHETQGRFKLHILDPALLGVVWSFCDWNQAETDYS